MKTILFDSKGNKAGTSEIPKSLVDETVNPVLLAQALRVHTINDRQGTKNVKGRSEVRGKAKKPFKQKGTGNARQGSRKGPHFKGGGVAHAPKMRDYNATLLNKMNKKAIKMALKKQVSSNKVFIFEGLTLENEKLTNQLNSFVKATNLKGSILLAVKSIDPKLKLAVRNIENLTIKGFNDLDVTSILKPKYILIEKAVL